jgi:hypothetical protein
MRILRSVILTLTALAFLAVPARAQRIPNLAKYDARPLLRVQAVGSSIAGVPFETDIFVYRGGPVFFMHSAEGNDDSARSDRAVASTKALSQLNLELGQARVGQQRGTCGEPAADYVAEYTVTWYGDGRLKTFMVGGNHQDCSPEIRRIMDAICAFSWNTLGSAIELCAPPVEE